MSRKRREEASHENHERWLITYSDLITLLMVFFVVMYAMSQVDAEKFKQVATSLNIAMGGGTTDSILDSPGTSLIDLEQMQMDAVRDQLQEYVDKNDMNSTIQLYQQERGLVISLSDTVLFASGRAELTPQAQEIMLKVGESLVGIPNYIRIEGHTDNLPIRSGLYDSNWELSAMRSSNVLRFLIREANLSPNLLSQSGYGEFRPIADNFSEAGRSRNRRVDIVVLNSKHEGAEPH